MFCKNQNYVITSIFHTKQNWIGLATDRKTNTTKIIKIIPLTYLSETQLKQTLESVSIAVEMSNQGIGPRIYEHGICTKFNFVFTPNEEFTSMLSDNKALYVTITEYLQGTHPSKTTSQKDWLHIAETLAKMHALGVLHNDLHPRNIIITTSGVKFIDFDMATRVRDTTPNIMFLLDTNKLRSILP